LVVATTQGGVMSIVSRSDFNKVLKNEPMRQAKRKNNNNETTGTPPSPEHSAE
jgi:hypothetical protein